MIISSILSAFFNIGRFSGRATRLEFSIIAIPTSIFYFICVQYFIPEDVGLVSNSALFIGLVLVYIFYAICVRRLHDIGYSGWLSLGIVLLSILIELFLYFTPNLNYLKYDLQWGKDALITLYLMISNGEIGANKYGQTSTSTVGTFSKSQAVIDGSVTMPIVSNLKRLNDLRESGIITDEEYTFEKSKLIK